MFIEFGHLETKLLIPILFPIFLKLRRLNREKNNFKSYAFQGFNDLLGLTFFGFLYLILKCRSKSEKDEIEKKQNEKTEKYSINGRDTLNIQTEIQNLKMKKEKKNKRKQVLFVLLISTLQLTVIMIKIVWAVNMKRFFKLNISPMFQVILLIVFSIFFLGLKMHSHQIMSVVIVSICLIIFFIESLIYYKYNIKIKELIIDIINYLCCQIFYCLIDVLGKKYLNKYIESPYLFLFKIGIIGLIPMTIYGIIAHFKNFDDKNLQIFKLFFDVPIYVYLIELLFSVLYKLGAWLTIYYFTPCHYIIFNTISDFFDVILSQFVNDDNESNEKYHPTQKITFFILYPILIFISLVFNEIIVLNCCGLNYNTKEEIATRGEKDMHLNIIEEDNSNEFNDGNSDRGYILFDQ